MKSFFTMSSSLIWDSFWHMVATTSPKSRAVLQERRSLIYSRRASSLLIYIEPTVVFIRHVGRGFLHGVGLLFLGNHGVDFLDKHLTGELIAIEVLYCLSGVGEDLDIASVDIQCHICHE